MIILRADEGGRGVAVLSVRKKRGKRREEGLAQTEYMQ